MASKNKQVLQTNHREQKTFSYTKGNANLSFVLYTDVKTEIKDFMELLEQALKDVQKFLGTNHPPKK
jgi:hypothetical protein